MTLYAMLRMLMASDNSLKSYYLQKEKNISDQAQALGHI